MSTDDGVPATHGRPLVERVAPPIDLVPPPSRWRPTSTWARYFVVALGGWLFVSSFMWPHSRASVISTIFLGTALFWSAAAALFVRWVRWISIVIALWVAAVALKPDHLVPFTRWNNLAVAGFAVAASLVPERKRATPRGGRSRRS